MSATAIQEMRKLETVAETATRERAGARSALGRGLRALGVFGLLAAGGLGATDAAAAPPETAPIWRSQLQVRTCDLANADTDDPVFASLRAGNSTALDYGRNDFPRNNTFTYDLLPAEVARFQDVTRLRISKTGTDALCVRSLRLRLNNREIFFRDFGAAGRWLDGSGGSVSFTITAAELRASAQWAGYQQPFPAFVLSRAEMESRVEAMAGTAISGSPAHWGHRKGARFVEATRRNASTLHFDLDQFVDTIEALDMVGGFDLLIDVLDFFGVAPKNPDLDVDFDLQITCEAGQLSFQVSEAAVDVDTIPAISLPQVPFPGIGNVVQFVETQLNLLADEAEGLIENAFRISALERGFEDGLNQMPPFGTQTPICPTIAVQANGDVVFGLP